MEKVTKGQEDWSDNKFEAREIKLNRETRIEIIKAFTRHLNNLYTIPRNKDPFKCFHHNSVIINHKEWMERRRPNSRNSSIGDFWLPMKVYGSDAIKDKYI